MPVSSPSRAIKLFFSYDISSSRDRAAWKELMKHLSILRNEQPIHEWYDSEVRAGHERVAFVEARLATADLIVLLLSPDFFASEHCYHVEMQRALARHRAGEARLLLVELRPSHWQRSPLAHYQTLPADGKTISRPLHRDSAFLEVAERIQQEVQELAHQPPAVQSVAVYNPPYLNNNFFTDRETLLQHITMFFSSASPQQTPVLALNGLGGVGKTQIALKYSSTTSHTYQSVLWLNASSRSTLAAEISRLAQQLALPTEDTMDELRLFAYFKQWLHDQPNWLLILDQLASISLLNLIVPHQSSGHVLVTTHMQSVGKRATALNVVSMDNDAGRQLLLQRAGLLTPDIQPPDTLLQEATAIVEAMGGFPLALDQAGAYIEEKGCDLHSYLQLYQEQRISFLSRRGDEEDDHRDSVMHTLAIAFEQVAPPGSTNLALLQQMAFLQHDTIDERLLTYGAEGLHEPLRSLLTDPMTLHDALGELFSFSLIHRNADKTMLRMQRIVQDILIEQLSTAERRQYARQAVTLIQHIFPNVSFATWAACERYLPQARHCASLIRTFKVTSHDAALLLERLGTYCSWRAAYSDAETYLTQSLRIYEQQTYTDSPDAAQAMNSLGLLYTQQARYREAETFHTRALTLRERVLGTDDPKTAESLHNLAMLYGDMGEYQQAEHLYLRVIPLEERAKGPEHPDVAVTLNNLALTYYQQGRAEDAETTYQRALAIYERHLSSDHPQLTYTLNGLGTLAEARGDYQHAEALYQRALTIRQQLLGTHHPLVAYNINALAGIAASSGNYSLAAERYAQALSIAESTLGAKHPDVALILNNLGRLLQQQKHYPQAETHYLRALTLYEHTMGAEHPAVASVLHNLGTLYKEMLDHKRAQTALQRALTIRQHTLGPTHPKTIDTLEALSN